MKQREPIVFIVDDDVSVREALASLLETTGLHAKSFGSAEEFLRYPRPNQPACLLLDVRMPGASGLELQRELTATERPLPIIFMTEYGDVPTAVGAMKAGAVEFLPKPFRESELLEAVRRALEQDRVAGRQRAERVVLRARLEQLTLREREVMAMLVQGRLNKQIAADLGISEITVKVHRHRIMEKMQASNFAELVRMVERLS